MQVAADCRKYLLTGSSVSLHSLDLFVLRSRVVFRLCIYLLRIDVILFEGHKKSVTAVHLEQLEDTEKEAREGSKIISQQEYVTRLRELNDEIAHAWLNNERVSALRLTIKVNL